MLKKICLMLFVVASCSFALDIGSISSIKSDFKQTLTNDQNKTISYEGTLYVKGVNNTLWVYTKPIKKRIYTSGDIVTIIEPSLNQASISKIDGTHNFIDIIKNIKKLSENRYVATYDDVKYYVEITDKAIKSISYEDKLNNRVVIDFYSQKINPKLDNKLFIYTIPKGYDIISS